MGTTSSATAAAERAARRLQACLHQPADVLSVLVWSLGGDACELRVWFDADALHGPPNVPAFFDGFSVRAEPRPHMNN